MTRLCRVLAVLFLLFALGCVVLFAWALRIDKNIDAAVFAICAVVNANNARFFWASARLHGGAR